MRSRLRAHSGFTIVELLVASTLGAIAMAALLSCFVFLARNFTRLSNYRTLETESRKAMTYLQADLAQAVAVKTGTLPSASTLTLTLPASEVTYTYDSTNLRLRRQATAGTGSDQFLLYGTGCRCLTFAFSYTTGYNGTVSDQFTVANNVPFSIKQIGFTFSLSSPTTESSQTRLTTDRFNVNVPAIPLRNKRPPDGN